ncbi:MAG: hypothetical protein IKX25_02025 [Bacteroidales bacterium]|nr:hypothetical protein [Bacteroidales bacterium]
MKTKDHNKIKLWFDRLLSKSLFQQFALLALVLVVAFGISYLMLYISYDNWKEFCDKRDISEWLLPLYLLIDSNALNGIYYDHPEVHAWMLFVSSLTFIFGAFIFNGAIIGFITNAIERRVTNHRKGHIHYLNSGHQIIMGYDDMVPSIINHIFAKDANAFILLLTTNDADSMREKLQKMFNDDQLKQIIINYGNRTSTYFFKGIHLESSEQIFIVGDRTSSTHDARNVECVDCIRQYLNRPEIKQRPKRITCVFDDLDTFAAFKTTEIFNEVRDLGIEFIPYNFYTGWAKQVFVKRYYKDIDTPDKVYTYPAVFGKGYTEQGPKALTPEDTKYVHLVFVGATNFAVAFAMEAAQTLHFPNFNKNNKLKTRITFIDLNADVEKDEFITRNRHFFEVQSYYYRDLSREAIETESDNNPRDEYVMFKEENGYKPNDANFLDVEFEFIKGDVFSHRVQKEIRRWAEDIENQYLSIFVAQSNQRQNFVLAMNMPDKVYDNSIPIFIRQDRSDNFVTDLREADKKKSEKGLTYYCVDKEDNLEEKPREARYANIYPFGMNETAFSADDNSLKRAKLINYLYSTAEYSSHKFKGMLALDSMSKSQIWEEADAAWRKLSVALKWSNLYCAYTIRTKLAILRSMRKLTLDDTSLDLQELSDDEVNELAKVEHNRWNVEKLLMGFRKAFNEEDKHKHEEFANKLENNKELFIHHDIRLFDGLDDIQKLDEEFSRYIPWIMKMTMG